MADQTLTLNLPEPLYELLKQRAAYSHRSLEDELLEVVAGALPAGKDLPDELVETVNSLKLMDDQALWKAAHHSRLSKSQVAKMEQLHFKRQTEDLSKAEKEHLADLVHQYERMILIRAEATGLLMERGYDVSSLRTSPRKTR